MLLDFNEYKLSLVIQQNVKELLRFRLNHATSFVSCYLGNFNYIQETGLGVVEGAVCLRIGTLHILMNLNLFSSGVGERCLRVGFQKISANVVAIA